VYDLDPEASEIFAFQASVGALFGLIRRDGTRVAMKVHKLVSDERYLDDMQAAQAGLATAGLPVPQPLGRRGNVTWEDWLDAGSFRDGHDSEVRRAHAATLSRLVESATALAVRPRRPLAMLPGGLWPVPHNALFDFEASIDGAEWIDEVARAAAAARDGGAGRQVVGHTDWAVKHVRYDTDLQPTVIYDWDSLDTQPETTIVGSAAGSFVYTEELEVDSLWPSVEESRAFVADYEEARGRPFTDAERRAAYGAAVYLGAYAARCHWAFARELDSGALEALANGLL